MTAEKYPKFNLKNKIVASLVGLILVIFSLLYFIVIPTIRDIKTMSNEIEGQKIDLEKKYIKGQSLRQLTENLKKIESKLDMLDQIFINKNRELEFITTLENQANKNRVSQKINLSAPQEAENQNFQKTDLQLFTKGSFLGQLQYLLDLEYLNYYINVKLLELSPAGAGEQTKTDSQEISPSPDETNNINMYINADTYWIE